MKVGILTKPVISEINLKVINTILEDNNFKISLAIIDRRPKLSLKKRILKNIRRGRGGYILIMFLNNLFTKKERSFDITAICKLKGIDMIETISPYSLETTSRIREEKLDVLLLINGYGIIKKELLTITPLGIYSYHHGNMRKYRGMPPAFWELYNNEREIGVTVQKLETGLDSGTPIVEKTIKINKYDTLSSLTQRIYGEGIDMMHQALIKLSDPGFKPAKLESIGKLYTLPNFRQWLTLKLKIIVRRIIRS